MADIGKKWNDRVISELTEQMTGYTHNGKEVPVRQIFNLLNRDTAAQTMFNTYITAKGAGWDLADEIEIIRAKGERHLGRDLKESIAPEDVFGWKLKNTENNKAIWRSMFDEEMPTEVARTPGGAPVTETPLMPITGKHARNLEVPALTAEAAKVMTGLSHEVLNAMNEVRRAQGLPAKTKRSWHTPSKNMTDKERVYLINEAGQTVKVASGPTLEAAMAQARREASLAAAGPKPVKLTPIVEDTVKRRRETMNEDFFGMENFQNAALQTGKSTGATFGEQVEMGPQLVQQQLEAIFAQLGTVWRDVYRVTFEPDLNNLQFMQAAAGLGKEEDSVYTMLQQTLLGLTKGHSLHPFPSVTHFASLCATNH